MPKSRSIDRAEWGAFFDSISDAIIGKRTEVEAASLEIGDQIVAERLPLLGLTYDSRNDLLDVSLGGLNHLIRGPREILIQDGSNGVEMIAVVTEGGAKHFLRLKDPLMLPAHSRR